MPETTTILNSEINQTGEAVALVESYPAEIPVDEVETIAFTAGSDQYTVTGSGCYGSYPVCKRNFWFQGCLCTRRGGVRSQLVCV